MNTITIDCHKIHEQTPVSSIEDFKKIWDQAVVFKDGVTNSSARSLNFKSAKELLPNFQIKLSNSLDNSDLNIQSTLHEYIDYCADSKPFEASYYYDSSGETGRKLFSNEPIYLFGHNVWHDEILKKFISCPEYLGDWFDKYFNKYRDLIVYGSGHTWLFVGPKNTKSEMHTDHHCVHTTIQQLDGIKRFFCIDKEHMQFIEDCTEESFLKSIEFHLNNEGKCLVSDLLGDKDLSIFNSIKVYWGDLYPGDLIYLPDNYGHYANSLTASFSVSRDFIDERNADNYFTSIMLEGDPYYMYDTIDSSELKDIKESIYKGL